jgi:hypothetical protein
MSDDSLVPPRRKSVYDEILKKDNIDDNSISSKNNKKRKDKALENNLDHNFLLEILNLVKENINLSKTSNFNKFKSSLELYLGLIKSETSLDMALIMQLYLNSFNLETNFDSLIKDIQKQLQMPFEQAVIQFIQFYYEWSTGLMPDIIQRYPEDKKYYDSLIKIVSKNIDKIDT